MQLRHAPEGSLRNYVRTFVQTTSFYAKKITLVQAQTKFFCVKSCKFEKFVVILCPILTCVNART